MTLHNTKAIIDFLDNHLFTRNLPYIAPIEANKLLEQEGLLNDSPARPGKPLRDLLRAGTFPHAIQPGGFNTEWFILHSTKGIIDLLKEQVLIWSLINDNMKVFEVIEDGFINDRPDIQFNHFFASAGFQFYRCIVLDLGTLFIDSKSHKSRFHLLTTNRYAPLLFPAVREEIKELLEVTLKDDISQLRTLRDRQYAHYDFSGKVSIAINFELLEVVKRLYKSAKEIIDKCHNNNFVLLLDFEAGESEPCEALKELINRL